MWEKAKKCDFMREFAPLPSFFLKKIEPNT
jgi:hypothetical protein